ncbi:OLC1v1026241C1 [Oldenlandia corymbosa var. corymbosa]|uniref:OLC1v1026241C1 n=1 Tax=Oldenlandia corymbosa var. corymbosa TaxID=529605 RepID=A0AAV1C7E9_OLDCO|nr:OLC1v1026241C1 [Oldenlandia corymbosa var. corymbosa]
MSGLELLLNLPLPIITDILSRLPTKSIVQCRCVCKTWLKLLSEKEFATLHLSRSPMCLIINKLDFDSSSGSCFSLVELEDEPGHHNLSVAGMKLILPCSCDEDGLTIVGTVNGLVCLNQRKYLHDAVYIWNPTLRESIALPTPEGVRDYPNSISYGFGLSTKIGQYKVVRIFLELEKSSRRILKSICHVYALGEGSWRVIGDCPYLNSCCSHGVFLNGNLHWLVADSNGSELISCFDLEKESFGPFPAPPELSKDFYLTSFGLFGSYLSVCDNTSDFQISIWVMKEYGIKNSWVLEFVIDKWSADLHVLSCEIVRVLKVFRDGVILLLCRDDILLSYNSTRETLHQFAVHKLIKSFDDRMNEDSSPDERYPRIEALEFVASFLSLKDFAMEAVETKNKTGRHRC